VKIYRVVADARADQEFCIRDGLAVSLYLKPKVGDVAISAEKEPLACLKPGTVRQRKLDGLLFAGI